MCSAHTQTQRHTHQFCVHRSDRLGQAKGVSFHYITSIHKKNYELTLDKRLHVCQCLCVFIYGSSSHSLNVISASTCNNEFNWISHQTVPNMACQWTNWHGGGFKLDVSRISWCDCEHLPPALTTRAENNCALLQPVSVFLNGMRFM